MSKASITQEDLDITIRTLEILKEDLQENEPCAVSSIASYESVLQEIPADIQDL